MFRSWTGLNNRSCTFAVYFTAITLQALNKENDIISCEEPAKIYNSKVNGLNPGVSVVRVV